MGDIAKALEKKGMKPALEIQVESLPDKKKMDEEVSPESEADEASCSPEELDVFKEYSNAESDEDKAMAMKAFIKLISS